MPTIDTMLFDLGGVLTCDPWQALILTTKRGLADRLGIDRVKAATIGQKMWLQYSHSIRKESDYWQEFSQSIGHPITANLIQQVEADTLEANHSSKHALAALDERGTKWGFITDNTSFWYPKQLKLLGLAGRRASRLDLTSFSAGIAKSSAGRNLFDVAADLVDPTQALVIDDKPLNLDCAARIGFVTLRYSMYDSIDLVDALEPYLK